jgi:hypothetical protein
MSRKYLTTQTDEKSAELTPKELETARLIRKLEANHWEEEKIRLWAQNHKADEPGRMGGYD